MRLATITNWAYGATVALSLVSGATMLLASGAQDRERARGLDDGPPLRVVEVLEQPVGHRRVHRGHRTHPLGHGPAGTGPGGRSLGGCRRIPRS